MSANVDEILKSAGIVPPVPQMSHQGWDDQPIENKGVPPVPLVPPENNRDEDKSDADLPLAAKLRRLGVPVALEVGDKVVAWLVPDDAAAAERPDLHPTLTATEAETLANLDETGIKDMLQLKAQLGGNVEPV